MLSTSARDPFSIPCEKAIPGPYYPIIITFQFSSPSNSHHKYPVLVVSSRIQLQVSVTVGQAIDRCFLPCRGAPTYPPRSINSGRTHFPGSSRPRSNNTPQPNLGLIERPARRTKPMPPGVMGHLPGNSCTLRGWPVSRPSYLLQQGRCLRSPTRRAQLSR